MPVSGVGSSGANYPAIPPSNPAGAYSYVMLGNLSDIAGSLAAKAAGGVAGTSAVSSAQQDIMNEEIEALADLAKIHLYLSAGDTQDAIAAANDFLSLNSQNQFNDPNVTALYSQVQSYFTESSGTVTGFQNDAQGKSFSNWWTSGTTVSSNVPGIQTAFQGLNLLKSDLSFGPSTQYPGVWVNISLMYADALSTPFGKTSGQLDTTFWGMTNNGSLFPYAMATYAYLECQTNGVEDWSKFNQTMSSIQTLLNDVKPADGVTFKNFPTMVSEFSNLTSQMAQNPSWPPPQAAGISSATYNSFLYYANKGMLSLYQNVFDYQFTTWRNG